MNLSKYTKTNELINSTNMNEKANRIIWLQMNKEEAAVALAKLHIIALAGASSSITLRNKSKTETDKAYKTVGDQLHAFAKEEGRHQLELEREDVVRLFRHIEFGESKFNQNKLF